MQIILLKPAALFNPLSLSGLLLWVKADQYFSVGNLAAVTTWPNLAVPANAPTNANANNKPTLQTAGTYGKAAIRFDGSDDILISPSAVLTDDNFSLFAVARGDPATSIDTLMAQSDGTATSGRWTVSNGNAANNSRGRFFFNNGSSFSQESSVVAFDNINPYLIRWESNNLGTSTMAINGKGVSATQGSQTFTPMNTGFRIAGIGSATAPSATMPVDVQEILVYQPMLTIGQRYKVEKYLCQKWGVLYGGIGA